MALRRGVLAQASDLVQENPLLYPRDTKTPEFQRLVSVVHESITTTTLPDLPPEVPMAGAPISRARAWMESIPLVPVGQILGLLSILHDTPDDISDEIGQEFGDTIDIVKAAEILELIDTPKDEVGFTELGRAASSWRQTGSDAYDLRAAGLQAADLSHHPCAAERIQGNRRRSHNQERCQRACLHRLSPSSTAWPNLRRRSNA